MTPAIAPICRDTASAFTTIANTSRPNWSVPSRWSGPGTSHLSYAASSIGSWPPPMALVISGLNSAIRISSPRMTSPVASRRLFRIVRSTAVRILIVITSST